MEYKKICLGCKREFITTNKNHKYCDFMCLKKSNGIQKPQEYKKSIELINVYNPFNDTTVPQCREFKFNN